MGPRSMIRTNYERLVLGYLIVLELNLYCCMSPGYKLSLWCSRLCPSCISIASRLYPIPPCVDHEQKETQPERRLSPSHAIIIIPPVIVHCYLQIVLKPLPSCPSVLCWRSCCRCQCCLHHLVRQGPSNACSNVSMRHSYCPVVHSSWCSG